MLFLRTYETGKMDEHKRDALKKISMSLADFYNVLIEELKGPSNVKQYLLPRFCDVKIFFLNILREKIFSSSSYCGRK